MPNAFDEFRAQHEAVEAVYEQFQKVIDLQKRLVIGVDTVRVATIESQRRTDELKGVLAQEQKWLQDARATVAEIRAWREREMRYVQPSVVRWFVAAAFAVISAAAAGAGYGWITNPYAAEIRDLQSR